MNKYNQSKIAIIGGGLTGLTTAFYLKKAGIDVHIFEKTDRVGGVIKTSHENGFTLESGPNTGVLSHPEAAEPDEMLYNLEDDPHEQKDLAAAHPERCAEGAARLVRWHDHMMATQPEGYAVDPMRTVLAEGGPFHARGALAAYCERLQATGRGESVALLRRKHPREFGQPPQRRRRPARESEEEKPK